MFERLRFWNHIPACGYLILSNEFCERFCYYGLLSILPRYMTDFLGFSQSSSVQLMSGINFSSYIFAFMGAILSDSYIGRFKTIASFSSLYAVGTILLSMSAIPAIAGIPPKWYLTGVALFIITVGTGGIKPCVSSFGGDQIPDVESRSVFFSYFYLMVNVGSFISMFATPLIKQHHCFGRDDCYSGAFALPAALMIVAVILFVGGKKLYKPGPPRNRIMLDFFGAVGSAIKNRLQLSFSKRSYQKPESFIYYASDKYSVEMLEHCRAMFKVFSCFIPMCLYWGLYAQMSSRWIFQAAMMSGKLPGGFTVMPEQMGIINCILVLILVPLFDGILYPVLAKLFKKPFSPFGKIVTALLLGSVSFVMAASLQWIIESKGTFIPDPKNAENQICVDGCVNMLWQFPQYLVLTISEVLLSVANLGLVYSMAPTELKSVCSAISMLTNAAGNLLVMLLAKVDPIGMIWKGATSKTIGNFLMWSALCLIGLVWFMAVTWSMDLNDEPHKPPIVLDEVVKVPDAEKTQNVEDAAASKGIES